MAGESIPPLPAEWHKIDRAIRVLGRGVSYWAMAQIERLPWPRTAEDGVTPVGIDLSRLHGDVRRLVIAGFAGSALARGIDPEDLVQEVMFAIHRRNHYAASAFDPRKASMGRYVHLIGRAMLINLTLAPGWHSEAHEDEGVDVADEAPDAEQAWIDAEGAIEEGAASTPAPWREALTQREAEPQRALDLDCGTSATIGAPDTDADRHDPATPQREARGRGHDRSGARHVVRLSAAARTLSLPGFG